MARPLYASFLPTIKCSNCGVEIEISAMGDHLCTGNPEAQAQTRRTDHDRLPASYLKPPGQTGPPFPLDKQRPFLPVPGPNRGIDFGFTTPGTRPVPGPAPLTTTVSDGAVPTTNALPIAPHVGPFARSVTEPIIRPARPPSESTPISQDPPYRPFPTRKSLSRHNAPDRLPVRSYSGEEPTTHSAYGPLSPSVSSGANVLKRMDSIAPGPFDARSRKDGDKNGPRSPAPPAAVGQSELESKRGASPTSQPPQRPPRPKTDDSLYEQLQSANSDTTKSQFLVQPGTKSEPSDERSTALQGSEARKIEESETEQVAPLPRFSQSNRSHSLTESESSTASQSISDSRTTSSRSSHSPLTSSPSIDQNYDSEPSKEHAPLSAVLEDASSPRAEQVDAADAPTLKQNLDERLSNSKSDGTPQQSRVFTADRRLTKLATNENRMSNASTAQLSPDSELRLSSLRYDPNVRNGRASGPIIAPPSHLGSKRRPGAPKSKCRGCGTPIVGKSIKAADGRLSGRWHRECFTCHTCKIPFQTADFYVLNDQPYCAHHYHELNHSLCHRCNTGIEGKYLETQPSQKYHMDCFTCHDCRKPLTKDYFEMNHQFFCEADAYRVWQKSKMLTPGKRFPERRQTRLMTMS